MDVDELDGPTSDAKVEAMPTFGVYKNGTIVDRLVGASREKLEALVRNYSL